MAKPFPTRACPFCDALIPERNIRCPECGEYVRRDAPPDDGILKSLFLPVNVSGWASRACYLSVIGFCLPCLGLPFALLAVVCGIAGLIDTNRNPDFKGQGWAIIGLVLGALSSMWGGLLVFLFVR